MRPHITSLKENARLTPVIMSIRFASPTVFAILHALIVDFFMAPKLFMMFIVQVWLVNSLWHTVSFDDVVFELLPQ
jgi:hypothetical protein